MIVVREEVVIPLGIEVAFDHFAEFENIASWDPGVFSSRKVRPGPLRVGDVLEVISVFAGRKIPMRYEVLSMDRPVSISLQGVASTGTALDKIQLESVDQSHTRITWHLEFRLKGLARLSEPLVRQLMNRLGKATMRGMLESARELAGADS